MDIQFWGTGVSFWGMAIPFWGTGVQIGAQVSNFRIQTSHFEAQASSFGHRHLDLGHRHPILGYSCPILDTRIPFWCTGVPFWDMVPAGRARKEEILAIPRLNTFPVLHQESEDAVKALAKEKDLLEREKWELRRQAKEATDHASALRSQLDLKDNRMKELEAELAMVSSALQHFPAVGDAWFGSGLSICCIEVNGAESQCCV